MATNFEKYAAKGNEIVTMIAKDIQAPKDKAARVLRAVLHALRNQLNLEESFQVMAQLPMILKAVYVDQWNPSKTFRRIHKLDEFIDIIREEDGKNAGYDFGNDQTAKNTVRAVFRALSYFLSEGEFEDIKSVMPADIKEFVAASIGEGRKSF